MSVAIVDVGDAARHSGGEIPAGGTEDEGHSAGHVLAGVVADAFDHGRGARVAHAEAFGGDAAHQRRARRGSVETGVAGDDVLFGAEVCVAILGRVDDHCAARQSFGHVVVGVALQCHSAAGH